MRDKVAFFFLLSIVFFIQGGCLFLPADFEHQFDWNFWLTHEKTGSIVQPPVGRGIVFVYFDDCQRINQRFDLTVIQSFTISVPCTDFIAVEVDPGVLNITTEFNEKDWDTFVKPYTLGSRGSPLTKSIHLSAGEKIYLRVDGKYIIKQWDNSLGARLEQWKPPFAYIKVCDRNVSLCGDSPWKPEAQAPSTSEQRGSLPQHLSSRSADALGYDSTPAAMACWASPATESIPTSRI